MPISRDEFERGQIDLGLHALAILREYNSEAWSFDELKGELEGRLSRDIPDDMLRLALRALEVGGKIEHKEIWRTDYYTTLPDQEPER